MPLHNLEGISCFGWDISASAALMAACAEARVALSFHTPHGKFLASVNGFTPGNIHLRREQYRRADAEPAATEVARNMVAAKISNSRHVLMRAARDHGGKEPERGEALSRAAGNFMPGCTPLRMPWGWIHCAAWRVRPRRSISMPFRT